jgi:1,4-dihydroxy-6-naphthoate synthase
MTESTQTHTIHVGHSPDSDDAFMFHALANDKIDTGNLRFVHELRDIETLNRRALNGELEVSAVSIHAYAYLADRYALLSSGSSMGTGTGRGSFRRSRWDAVTSKGRR